MSNILRNIIFLFSSEFIRFVIFVFYFSLGISTRKHWTSHGHSALPVYDNRWGLVIELYGSYGDSGCIVNRPEKQCEWSYMMPLIKTNDCEQKLPVLCEPEDNYF